MTNQKNTHPESIPGAWYVDDQCIICGQCSEYAPDTFRADSAHVQNIVYRQPATAEELAAAREAKEICPTESIHNDGIAPAEIAQPA